MCNCVFAAIYRNTIKFSNYFTKGTTDTITHEPHETVGLVRYSNISNYVLETTVHITYYIGKPLKSKQGERTAAHSAVSSRSLTNVYPRRVHIYMYMDVDRVELRARERLTQPNYVFRPPVSGEQATEYSEFVRSVLKYINFLLCFVFFFFGFHRLPTTPTFPRITTKNPPVLPTIPPCARCFCCCFFFWCCLQERKRDR